MKIVYVLPTLLQGGGERVACELANHAVKAGHQVAIITGSPVGSSLLKDGLHPDIQIHYVSGSASSRFGKYICIFSWLRRHWSWLAEQDILHCHLTYGAVFGFIAGFLRGSLSKRSKATVELCA